jgi:imidazole glycerol-phosphate synthase subunit HisF
MVCAEMLAKRIIARLDVKAPNLVKGIRLEGFRVLGKPADFATRYDAEGIDELLYVDMVASLYGRNSLTELIEATANLTFTPLCVGGGIRTIADVDNAFRAGADKVAINTAAITSPALITEIAETWGSQACVLSVEAKRTANGWEAYTDNGREKTGMDVLSWVRRAVDLGAGEVLLTSVDRDGTRKGMDLDLISAVTQGLSVPVVASGGAGSAGDVAGAFAAGASAVACGSLFHYGVETVGSLKAKLRDQGVTVREAA